MVACQLARSLGVVMAVSTVLRPGRWNRPLGWALGAASVVVLLGTGSRTAWLALFVAVVCLRAIVEAEWSGVMTLGMMIVFAVAMGSLMIKAGKAFQAIVDTAGNDIAHLMAALDNLRQVYSILSVIIILTTLLGLVAVAVSWMSSGGGPDVA